MVDKRTAAIFLIVMAGSLFLHISPVWFVVVSAVAGILLKTWKGGLRNDLSASFLGIFKTGLFAVGGGMATVPFLKTSALLLAGTARRT